ncbi:hypothetical protein BCAH1134_C0741 (plasmid) [Bacillus cereus AH1134]|nr:hypothetical protein BCAH1134_C0741 [Bacillus cereus AH1134]
MDRFFTNWINYAGYLATEYNKRILSKRSELTEQLIWLIANNIDQEKNITELHLNLID